jgi:hypothetical protein
MFWRKQSLWRGCIGVRRGILPTALPTSRQAGLSPTSLRWSTLSIASDREGTKVEIRAKLNRLMLSHDRLSADKLILHNQPEMGV